MTVNKKAFTMIELVFVIVILGILAAMAIPRFAATRTDAQISKGRADVATIRSAIITERQARLITGDSAYISGITLNGGTGLFSGVLTYGMTSSTSDGHWATNSVADTNATSTVDFHIGGGIVVFTYTRDTSIFTCDPTVGTTKEKEFCKQLIN